jgi:hypothetical protein
MIDVLNNVERKYIATNLMQVLSSILLESARKKLLSPYAPVLLRIVGFVRLSCNTLDKPGAYSQLMQALSEHNKEWWKACEILPDGMLFFSDPAIHALLEPVLQLHPQIMSASLEPADHSFSSEAQSFQEQGKTSMLSRQVGSGRINSIDVALPGSG